MEEPSHASGRELLAECQEGLQAATERLRMICLELRPPALGPFGVESAIRAHAERFHQAHPELTLTLDLMPDDKDIPERTRLGLFRIYQQAMANLVQHASADNVRVRMWREPGHVYLEVLDDGRGFAVPGRLVALARSGHLGLLGAAERAEYLGGRLEVESAVGEGTRVRARVPADDRQ
jgi:two-component system sensor histidine kinase UhpB